MTIKELCKKHINCAVCPYLPICGDIPEKYNLGDDLEVTNAIIETAKALEPRPIEKCKWIKYDYKTMCPKEHIDIDSPYWRIPENRMDALKYCPYCGKEIEVTK